MSMHARLETACNYCNNWAEMGQSRLLLVQMQEGKEHQRLQMTKLKSVAVELIQPSLKVSKLCSLTAVTI